MDEPKPRLEKNRDDEANRREAIAAELLTLLRCPETRQTLAPAGPELVAQLEAARVMGRLRNGAGQRVQEPVEGGLVRADGTLFFPVRNGIPVLLGEEAVALPPVIPAG